MFIEFAYGLSSNSLSLISDAVHMLFDSLSLMMGLYVTFMSTFTSTSQYSYGYGRAEIMSGFINAIFLIFVAFYILLESIERILEPEEIRSGGLLLVSFLGLVINLIGLKFFHEHAHSHGEGGSCSHGANNDHHDHHQLEQLHDHHHDHHQHDHHEHEHDHAHHNGCSHDSKDHHSHHKHDENIQGRAIQIMKIRSFSSYFSRYLWKCGSHFLFSNGEIFQYHDCGPYSLDLYCGIDSAKHHASFKVKLTLLLRGL